MFGYKFISDGAHLRPCVEQDSALTARNDWAYQTLLWLVNVDVVSDWVPLLYRALVTTLVTTH